jgi:hypothetical protein
MEWEGAMRALALLTLVALPSVGLAQSLGDAARQEAERRKKAQSEGRGAAAVIDERALEEANAARPDAPVSASPAAPQPEARTVVREEGGAAVKPTAVDDLERERSQRAKDEQMWRERAASANARVEKARARYEAVKDATLAPGQVGVDRRGRVVVRSPEHLQRLVAQAKDELAAAEKAVEDLVESARRAGVPAGWLR